MRTELVVERRTPLAATPEEAFAWHARPGALERLTPPWLRIEVLERGEIQDGARTRLRLHRGPFQVDWVAEHVGVEPGRGFGDRQVQGPFERWEHQHRFDPGPDGRAVLHDRVECLLPSGLRPLRGYVVRELERLFRYRHEVTAADLAQAAERPTRPLHVAVTGASGFLGTLLLPRLTTAGHRVTRLVRRTPSGGELRWDPGGAGLAPESLRGVDAVIHLAGENIVRRWTPRRKAAILESRRRGTRVLAEALARAPNGQRVLLSASAIGFYGDRGDELLTEESPAGTGFLPEVAREWEAAAASAEQAGIRVVRLRIGLPLSPAGGLLKRMLPPFRLGLGGKLGNGRQWMSWISADDLLGVMCHALDNGAVQGPVNAVAPNPVRNAEFAAELARMLRRPAVFAVPAAALRLRFGQMADEAILASARVAPRALERGGYRFRHENLGAALAHVLGKEPVRP